MIFTSEASKANSYHPTAGGHRDRALAKVLDLVLESPNPSEGHLELLLTGPAALSKIRLTQHADLMQPSMTAHEHEHEQEQGNGEGGSQ